MKKSIILSLAMIVAIGAVVVGATGAFFSDTETSTGNTFTAGAIDLTVDSEAHYAGLVCKYSSAGPDSNGAGYYWSIEDSGVGTSRSDLVGQPCNGTWALTDLGPTNTFFDYADLKPGDEGENTISLHIDNNDAYMCAIIDKMQDNDNGLTEPEEEDGDVTGGDGEGELSQELHFFAWADDGDNVWENGEQMLFSNIQGPASDVINGRVYPMYTPDSGAITGGDTKYIGMYWCYGAINVDEQNHTLTCDGGPVDNKTQTDSLSADISFYVEQARNNENFVCPSID